jgi:glycosyltransferase involved in cell wall biosynthesis
MASDLELPSVCVVTHPLSAAGENATRSLLDILAAITAVSLVTADLPAGSEIREQHELVELTQKGAGDNVVVAAFRFLRNQLRMVHAISRQDEEIILFFGATAYLLPIVAARIAGRTVIVEPRGDVPLTLRLHWEEQMAGPLARWLARLVRLLELTGFAVADGVVTYTPSMAQQLGLDPSASDVYPFGARYVRTDEFRMKTPYTERNRRIGFLGRLDEEKGIRELAAVAKRLDETTFTFVGDGPLSDWLRSELATEIDEGEVELRGWVSHDEVPVELNRFRLLVMPSSPTEGLPTTILEAMACGTPVYASPVSGIPDAVQHGETGFLMRSRDPDDIANQISQLLAKENLERISAHCRRRAETEYSFEAACERYTDIIDRLTVSPTA